MPDKGQRRSKRAPGREPDLVQSADPAPRASPTGCAGWLWWRASAGSPERPLLDYYNERKVPKAVRAEFDTMRKRYKTGQLRDGANIKNIGDSIIELKYAHIGNTPFRLLFFRWGKWAVCVDVFKKTTNETPKDRAVKRRKAWIREFGEEPPA